MTILETYSKLTHGGVNRVNAHRRLDDKVRDALVPKKMQQRMVADLHLAAEMGLARGLLVEASMKVGNGRFLTTARNVLFQQLTVEQLITVTPTQAWQQHAHQPPRHHAWHQAIYSQTAAQVVMLIQPTAATAMAAQQRLPALELLVDADEAVASLGLNTPDLLASQVATAAALLIPGHGLLLHGDDFQQLLGRADTINRWCEIALAANR